MRLNIAAVHETKLTMVEGQLAQNPGKWRWSLIVVCILLAAMAIGFAVFASAVGSIEKPTAVSKADAIIVLTGGQKRLAPALELLGDGKGQKLLISGVHPTTTMEDIQKITSIDPTLYDCCVELDHLALDTVGNATQSMRWAEENGFKRVILVTSNYHMPRSLIEMRRVNPDLEIVPYPIVNTDLSSGKWLSHPEAYRVIAIEYAKYIAARLRFLSEATGVQETAYAIAYGRS